MAVLWSQQKNNTSYQVTNAGSSIRLYRNKVLHSQWNPRDPIKGYIWELFLLASLMSDIEIKRVLVLGTGGGAVVNLVHYFFDKAHVDAIDLDERHLYVAKKYFNINIKKCCLIHQDAKSWVMKFDGEKYDLIIEDLFSEQNKIPYRAVEADYQWVKRLLSLLNDNGSLVMNFADQSEWKKSRDQLLDKRINKKYHASVANHKCCDNRIVYISKNDLSSEILKERLNDLKEKSFLKYWQAGDFRYRRLW